MHFLKTDNLKNLSRKLLRNISSFWDNYQISIIVGEIGSNVKVVKVQKNSHHTIVFPVTTRDNLTRKGSFLRFWLTFEIIGLTQKMQNCVSFVPLLQSTKFYSRGFSKIYILCNCTVVVPFSPIVCIGENGTTTTTRKT